MSGISINYGPISIDLKKFVDFLKAVVKGDLDAETKKVIKEAIDEVLSGYHLTADCVTPFLKVGGGRKFKEQFTKEYSNYIDAYGDFLKIGPSQMPACHKVYDMLDTVSGKRRIRDRIPGFGNRRDEMKDLADNWMINDDKVFKGQENFQNMLLSKMRYIYIHLDEGDITEAQNVFNSFINETMTDLKDIQRAISVLESIKRRI